VGAVDPAALVPGWLPASRSTGHHVVAIMLQEVDMRWSGLIMHISIQDGYCFYYFYFIFYLKAYRNVILFSISDF